VLFYYGLAESAKKYTITLLLFPAATEQRVYMPQHISICSIKELDSDGALE
jgi:hypothetical protein